MVARNLQLFLLAVLFLSNSFDIHAHPSHFSEDDEGNEDELRNSWTLDDLEEGNEHHALRDEALEKLQQVRVPRIVPFDLLVARAGE